MGPSTLENHFLVAMPSVVGEFFERSVVLIYEHTEEGSMGIIINKPTQIDLSNLLGYLDIELTDQNAGSSPILMGGPVDREQGFIIHDESDKLRKTPMTTQVIISSSKGILQSIAKGMGPRKYLIAIGYASWAPGQLNDEICHNRWLVVPVNEKILFTTSFDRRWAEAARLIGIDIHQMSSNIGHA